MSDRAALAMGLAGLAAASVAAGCVRRTILITSEPPGALVWLNDREIGRTPVVVDFEYYGTYDVRLQRPGYEPLMTSGTASAPWWEIFGVDLLSELAPFPLRSWVQWQYELEPRNDDPEALIERAQELRARIPAEPGPQAPAEPSSPSPEPHPPPAD